MVSDLTECGFRVHECKAKCQNVQKMIFFLGFNLSIWLNVVGGTGQVLTHSVKDLSSLRCNPVRSFPECKVRFLSNNVCFSVKTVQSWDLVQQTQNYLKLLLHIINSDGRCVFLLWIGGSSIII